ncbi:hypothetical protein [Xanthobacter tagetidis]|jgi:hypothetical protein|uniref:Uncharacterized protein n=1 Tax=Xanthobacter tagetidis TaxID=60216 RepID=A0A3L7A208_9HYPH|nr:hypothetical protein [Xanthobacter tagetidis]MBB6309226.1 hypothetical protein [Xanthobacter tagetidis]RLP74187.1 hypothetical protein D9R14_19185 [Xanthobacter tagetidis]
MALGTDAVRMRGIGQVRRRGSARAAFAAPAAIAALALALAGCGAGEGLDGAFGAQDVGVAGASAGVSSTPGSLTVGSGPNAIEYECPKVTVRTGASTWQVQAREGGLRYQGTIGQLARECSISGANMAVKVGIEGRVLVGEKGTAGALEVPIRIAVVQEGPNPKTVATKFFVLPLEIPQGQVSSTFAVVEDQLTFPLVKPDEIERYVIYVGYDPQGEPKIRPARSAQPRPSASSSSSPRPAAPAPSAAAKPKPAATPAAAPAGDPGAPKDDVFGPPPSGPTSNTSSSGGFAPPPSSAAPASSGGFAPPPR